MKSLFQTLFATVAILTATSTASAQNFEGMARSMPSLHAVMAGFFGEITNFSAQVEIRVETPGDPALVMPMKWILSNGHMREEIDASRLSMIPPEMGAGLKAMDVNDFQFIIRFDRQKIYIVFPNIRAYQEVEMPESAIRETSARAKQLKLDSTPLGAEIVDGRTCMKTRVVVHDIKHESATVWYAKELRDFPVKVEIASPQGLTKFHFKDVVLNEQDAELFEVPKDHRYFASSRELTTFVQERFKRKIGQIPEK